MSSTLWVLFVFFAYFAALIGIAVLRTRSMNNMSDYVLGGRRMGLFTAALSAASSACSGWTMLVFPALAFAAGMLHLWTVVFIVLGVWFTWTILAKRLRRYTMEVDDSLTIPDFLEKRFRDTSGVIRILAAIISLYFITLYVCSGLIAGAKLLQVIFNLDQFGAAHDIGVLITLAAIVSYTFLGGFLAVSRTDVFQSLIMLSGFIIIPVTMVVIWGTGSAELTLDKPGFWNPFTNASNEPVSWAFVASSIGWGLGGFGSLRVLSRLMAVERESDLGRSRNVATVWVVLMFALGLVMGLVAAPAILAQGIPLPDPEKLYVVVATEFFHPIIAGLLLTAVIAAVMSTADSQLLLASAIASDDAPILKRVTAALDTHSRVWIGRLLLIIVGLVAAIISIVSPESIFALVSLAWGGMGAAFGPVLIMALYWRRFNLQGAITSVAAGATVATFWWLMGLGSQLAGLLAEATLGAGNVVTSLFGFETTVQGLQEVGIWNINPAVPGFIAAVVMAVIVTKLTAPPSDEITATFDRVNSPDWQEPARQPAAEPGPDGQVAPAPAD